MHGDLNNHADRVTLNAWLARQDEAGKRVVYELDGSLPPFAYRLERGTLYCGANLWRHCEQFLLAKGIDPSTREVRCDGAPNCDAEPDRSQAAAGAVSTMQQQPSPKAADALLNDLRPILADYVSSTRYTATLREMRTVATIAAASLLAESYSLTGLRQLTEREHQELTNTLVGICRMWESTHPSTQAN